MQSSLVLGLNDPSSPGSATVVTSAEQLTLEISKKLLSSQNVTQRFESESDGVGLWMDVSSFENNEVQSPDLMTLLSVLGEDGGSFEMNSSMYIFPNNKTLAASSSNQDSEFGGDSDLKEEKNFFHDVIMLPRASLLNRSIVTNVRYKNLKKAIPTRFSDEGPLPEGARLRQNVMNSDVLTTSVYPAPPSSVFVSQPVTIIFKHEREPKNALNISLSNTTNSPKKEVEETPFCVYWEEQTRDADGGAWSKKGCTLMSSNQTHTVCNCIHLTSFAVLLQIVDYNTDDDYAKLHQQVLGVVSKVGCIVSLLGVTIMCAAFIKLKFHTDNMKIHFNLGIAVGVADLVFLFEELAESSKPFCILITVLLYYFNMGVLAWMLIEGVHLYSQVVVVFVSVRRRFKYYAAVGWGIPVLFLTVSMSAMNIQLHHHETCWLSPADNTIWAFAAPALFVIFTNLVILIAVVRVIVQIRPSKSEHLKVSKLRNAVKGSIFLFPLLGTTWLFGLLSLSKETLVFQYLFATTNSLQGFFLFIFHCVCNSEVREDARRHKWFWSNDSTYSSSPPVFSNAFSLNVASGIRRFRNSISFEAPSFSSSSSGVEEHNEGEEMKGPGKITSLFQKMLTRMPATIAENEDKCDEKEASPPEPVELTADDPEKHIPLPGMPTKNDTIHDMSRFKRAAEQEKEQMKLDQILVDQIVQSALKELFKEGDPSDEEYIKTLINEYVSDKNDEKKIMKMSYDSGLNSIENDSILDEDDEVWMTSQQKQTETAMSPQSSETTTD